MRFAITRLCGGKALMAAPRESMDLDLEHVADVLSDDYILKQKDDMMLVMDWNGMEITIYPQGKVMFHPLSDKDLAVEYATDILNRVV